ncbi:MAG: LPXTG cell wall anchor domain-containing protein [Actinomycetota bacterium]
MEGPDIDPGPGDDDVPDIDDLVLGIQLTRGDDDDVLAGTQVAPAARGATYARASSEGGALLPFTGAAPRLFVLVGLLLMAAGALFILRSRRAWQG